MKQNLTLRVYQSSLNTEFAINDKLDYPMSKIHFETYLPLFNSKSFSSVIGTSYSKFTIQAENDSLSKSLQENLLMWLPIQLKFKKWRITLLYEHILRGGNISLFQKTGNAHRFYLLTAYEFNPKWQIILLGGYANSEDIILNNQTYNYNNIKQQQSNISLKLGIKAFKNVGFFLSGGYNIGKDVKLYNNDKNIINTEGDNQYFIGLHVQYLRYF